MLNSKKSNIYYFRHINSLGGIETFFYELAKKYQEYDLTIYYKTGNIKQIQRLKKYVRCIQYNGEEIECDKAFFNFNMEIADKVKAKEKILVVHGNYKFLDKLPDGYEKMDRIVAVSKDSAKAFEELSGRKVEVCYNPLEIEEVKPVIHLVVASRLKDKIKGGNRVIKLINKLDEYALLNNRQYEMLAFTDINEKISDNVIFKTPRLDIRPYLKDADFVIQLSDEFEGYNYTVNESLSYGTPVVITPCNVYDELDIDDTMSIRLNFDLSNIDQVVKDIFNKKFNFTYTPPKDRWEELLEKSKSNYKEEQMKNYKVKAILDFTDMEEDKQRKIGDIFEVNEDRFEYLSGNNKNKTVAVELLEIIEPIEPDEFKNIGDKKERTTKETKPKKTAKKKNG